MVFLLHVVQAAGMNRIVENENGLGHHRYSVCLLYSCKSPWRAGDDRQYKGGQGCAGTSWGGSLLSLSQSSTTIKWSPISCTKFQQIFYWGKKGGMIAKGTGFLFFYFFYLLG